MSFLSKGVFVKNEKGYWLMAKIILLLSVASIRRTLLKMTHAEECSVHQSI